MKSLFTGYGLLFTLALSIYQSSDFNYAHNQSANKIWPKAFQVQVKIDRIDPHIQFDPEPTKLFPGTIQAWCLREGYNQNTKEA